jgi:GT2 family glycosyltransferase
MRGTSPLVFFLNSDVILDAGSMNYLVRAMDEPKVGVAGMKLVFPEHTDLPQDEVQRPAGKIQHIGLATNIRAEVFHQFLGWSENHPKVNALHDMYAVTGAALMTRRWLFNSAGKFNEAYGRGTYEDVDFCLTVRKMGYNVVVVPEARGIHHTGATAVKYQISYPMNENRTIFLQRWQKELDWTEFKNW